jgi:hypothetical protein
MKKQSIDRLNISLRLQFGVKAFLASQIIFAIPSNARKKQRTELTCSVRRGMCATDAVVVGASGVTARYIDAYLFHAGLPLSACENYTACPKQLASMPHACCYLAMMRRGFQAVSFWMCPRQAAPASPLEKTMVRRWVPCDSMPCRSYAALEQR